MSVNPYQPPSTMDAAPVGGIDVAAPATRLLAVIIEGLVLMPLTLPISYLMGNFDGIMTGRQPPLLNVVAMTVIGFVIFLGVNWVFLGNGQTVGKRVMGVQIVDLNGSVLPVPKLMLARYLPWWAISAIPVVGGLFALIDALFIFRKDRRCLHDHIAGTRVVRVITVRRGRHG